MEHDLFISYRSRDLDLAERLYARLRDQGFRVWFDKARLNPGFDWHREVEVASEASRVIIPVLTPDWKTSEWCRFETYGGERIVPLLFAGEWSDVAPPALQHFQYVDVRQPERTDWSALSATIRGYLNVPAPQKVSRVASLRYSHNAYFVGREQLLLDIYERLHPAPSTALTSAPVHAISGIGGVGKTTLAREYAEKFWRLYQDILWVSADAPMLQTEFARVALELRLVQAPSRDANDDARSALRELNSRTPRLLIVDNAVQEESIQQWLPTTGSCKTIVTSRFAGWSAAVHAIGIDVLGREAARELLMRRSNLEGQVHWLGADRLAEELGCLPLALEQAAAFMFKVKINFDEYLALYARHRHEMLAERARGGTQYPASVATTWRTTIKHVSNDARSILRLIAHLAPEDIPMSLLKNEVRTTLALHNALGELAEYSMIRLGNGTLGVHRLVQAVQQDDESERNRRAWAKRAVLAVSRAFPAAGYENFMDCARLLPHARAAAAAVSQWKFRFGEAALLLNQVAIYLQRRGQLAEAEPFFLQALDIWRASLLGRFNPYVATGLSNLGILYNEQGKYSAAEIVLVQALALRPRFLRPQDPLAAGILSALAIVHESRSDYAPAETCYREAIEIRRRTVGARGELYAESLSNLANVYSKTHRYAEAEQCYLEALDITRQRRGENHPVFTQISQNLAVLYYRQGRYAEAEALYLDALKTREAALGPDHPDLAYILTSLGKLYRDERKHNNAKQLFLRAVKLRSAAFGETHPELARTLSYLGTVYTALGEHDEAETVHRRARDIVRATLDGEHPLAATVRENHEASLRAANRA
jgi:tetratricopeptide (TPR) repeat protein